MITWYDQNIKTTFWHLLKLPVFSVYLPVIKKDLKNFVGIHEMIIFIMTFNYVLYFVF